MNAITTPRQSLGVAFAILAAVAILALGIAVAAVESSGPVHYNVPTATFAVQCSAGQSYTPVGCVGP